MKPYTTKPGFPGFLKLYQEYILAMSLNDVPESLQKHNLEGM